MMNGSDLYSKQSLVFFSKELWKQNSRGLSEQKEAQSVLCSLILPYDITINLTTEPDP
jgi:hypothetical protein